MTVALIALVLLGGLAGGLWFAWRQGLAGETALPGPLGSVQAHLQREGLDTHARLVQRARWDGVQQHASFQLVGDRDRRFYIVWFDSAAAAERQRRHLLDAARPSHPQARGELLLYLTDWPTDDPATQRVIAAFQRWPAGGAASNP